MKYLRQFLIILFVSFLGEVLNYLIPLPIPASIYGILLMFLALELHIIPLSAVRETGRFLIEIMPVMFIPAAVGLLKYLSSLILLSKKNLEENLFTIFNNNTALNNNLSEQSFSSNLNSNNISNIINQSNINDKNSINTFEENVNVKAEIKNKIFDEENNLNTVDEEKITNIESETNFKKDYIINEKNIVNDIDNITNKNRKKYNESFIEKNSDLSDIN